MSTNKQKFTGKKRNHPEDISEIDSDKIEEIRNKYNENYQRRNCQNQSLNLDQNQPSKLYENIKDQKIIKNNNNYYKKSVYQNASLKSKHEDNYSVSPSRSPSIKESIHNANSARLSDEYDDVNNYTNRNYQHNMPGDITIGFLSNLQYDSGNEGKIRSQPPQKKDLVENSFKRRDSKDFSDKNFNRDIQHRTAQNYRSIDHYGQNANNYIQNQKHNGKNLNRDSNRYTNIDHSPKNFERSIRGKNEGNKEGYGYSRRSDDYNNTKNSHYQKHNYNSTNSDRERERNFIEHHNKYR